MALQEEQRLLRCSSSARKTCVASEKTSSRLSKTSSSVSVMKILIVAVCFMFVLLVDSTVADWWQLGVPKSQQGAIEYSPSSDKDHCQRLDFLSDKQKELCNLNDKILGLIGSAARLGIDECQYQFRHSRWNCSTFTNSTSVFGGVLGINSRETAYIYAVSAASVAFSITRACSRGELNECTCDNRIRHGRKSPKNWQWGGCSEDIHYGEKFSRDFVDVRENPDTATGLMNLHNNEAGRRTIRSRMQRICKCHGVSGSCSMRVCWRKMPSFRIVGEVLASRYEGASHVKLVERRGRRGGARKKLRAISPDMKKPNKTDLVYLDDSPDYCERNETLGIPGTKGRICNRTSHGLDGCRLLCCGRGYQTRVREVEEKCRCRFVWCCNVECDMCRFRKEEHVCN